MRDLHIFDLDKSFKDHVEVYWVLYLGSCTRPCVRFVATVRGYGAKHGC